MFVSEVQSLGFDLGTVTFFLSNFFTLIIVEVFFKTWNTVLKKFPLKLFFTITVFMIFNVFKKCNFSQKLWKNCPNWPKIYQKCQNLKVGNKCQLIIDQLKKKILIPVWFTSNVLITVLTTKNILKKLKIIDYCFSHNLLIRSTSDQRWKKMNPVDSPPLLIFHSCSNFCYVFIRLRKVFAFFLHFFAL